MSSDPAPDVPGTQELLLRALIFAVAALGISNLLVLDWVDSVPLAHVRASIAAAAAWLLTLLGLPASASGDLVHLPQDALRIVNSCTGLDASLLLACAVLVFPASLRARLIGVALSFAVIGGLNFTRVITLAYLTRAEPGFFELAHLHVWPALVVVACLATLLGWIQHTAPRGHLGSGS